MVQFTRNTQEKFELLIPPTGAGAHKWVPALIARGWHYFWAGMIGVFWILTLKPYTAEVTLFGIPGRVSEPFLAFIQGIDRHEAGVQQEPPSLYRGFASNTISRLSTDHVCTCHHPSLRCDIPTHTLSTRTCNNSAKSHITAQHITLTPGLFLSALNPNNLNPVTIFFTTLVVSVS